MSKLLILLLFFLPLRGMANDVFGFLSGPCNLKLGVPVDHTDGQLTILTPEGKTETFPSEDLTAVAHYVLPGSVFQFSDFSKEAQGFIKNFDVKDTDLSIKGFPYQFIDGTIFILDLKGARRVIGQEELGRVEVSHADSGMNGKNQKLPKFALPAGIAECSEEEKGQLPVRFIADKIQILETINNWEKGFRDLNILAERSVFYPRPFLFEKYDRFGFIMFNGKKPEIELIPVRYSFNNGRDFGFQGQTSLGGGFDTIGPRVTPMNLLSTELKFHFLHASFEGNLNGMGVGSSIYSKSSAYSGYSEKHTTESLSDVTFNHLAMIGFDYAHWGLSVGTLFPSFYIQAGKESREAKPQKSLPLLRLTWTGEKVKFKVSGTTGKLDASSEVNRKSNVIFGDAGEGSSANFYKMNFKYFRAGAEWDVTEDTKLSSDLIWTQWDYKEMIGANSLKMDTEQLAVSGAITRNFGQYVSLGVFGIWQKPDEKSSYNTENYSRTQTRLNFGGTLDFLF